MSQSNLHYRTFVLLLIVVNVAFGWLLWPFYGAVLGQHPGHHFCSLAPQIGATHARTPKSGGIDFFVAGSIDGHHSGYRGHRLACARRR